MKCAICGLEAETIDEAIESGWIPYFYEGEVEHGPVCASCAETMIGMGEDGEMELKSEYHGKIHYLDGDYSYHATGDELVVGIIMTEERKGEGH